MAMYKPHPNENNCIKCIKDAFKIDIVKFKLLMERFNKYFLTRVYCVYNNTLHSKLTGNDAFTIKLGCDLCGSMAMLLMQRSDNILKNLNANSDEFLASLRFDIIYVPKVMNFLECFLKNNNLKKPVNISSKYIVKNCKEFAPVFTILSTFNNLTRKLDNSILKTGFMPNIKDSKSGVRLGKILKIKNICK